MGTDTEKRNEKQPLFFACCEDCGATIIGETAETIKAAIVVHRMDGCDE